MEQKNNSISYAETKDDSSTNAELTTSAPITPNLMLAAVQGMSITGKNKLVAIWMSKERVETFKTIDILFYLDDKWNEIYQQFRIKEGFSAAQLKANTHILSLVYGSQRKRFCAAA